MYCCKDLKSLLVLSLYEGELLGTVDKLFVDKKMKRLCEIELVGANGVKLVLPTKNIYRVGKNAITVKNNQAVLLKSEEGKHCVVPLSSKVYSLTGEYLGMIEELSFDEKFITKKISLDNNSVLNVDNIASIGKNIVVFHSENEKVNLKNFVPKKQPKVLKSKEVKIVKVLPIETMPPIVEDVEKKIMVQNSDFLLGRICTKDIFNFNNELLIKAHAVVNKKNLKEINRFGKLRELMIYSK